MPSITIIKYREGWLMTMRYSLEPPNHAWDDVRNWIADKDVYEESDYPRIYVIFKDKNNDKDFCEIFEKYIRINDSSIS